MPLHSMTGFAQAARTCANGSTRVTWDVKTLNAKGLDVRLRVPPGFDGIELESRRRIADALVRGTCHGTLTIAREARPATVRIDQARLSMLLEAVSQVTLPANVAPASLDGLLALKGVVEIVEGDQDAPDDSAVVELSGAVLADALAKLVAMRADEGAALSVVVLRRLQAIESLARAADHAPERQPDAIRMRLAETLSRLAEHHALDPQRLHSEAVLLAAKADVREELDRIYAHVASARDLIAVGGAVGRRLDFLSQELGREASTFCAKVNDAALTALGLEMRVEIEQMREQVQNVE